MFIINLQSEREYLSSSRSFLLNANLYLHIAIYPVGISLQPTGESNNLQLVEDTRSDNTECTGAQSSFEELTGSLLPK